MAKFIIQNIYSVIFNPIIPKVNSGYGNNFRNCLFRNWRCKKKSLYH